MTPEPNPVLDGMRAELDELFDACAKRVSAEVRAEQRAEIEAVKKKLSELREVVALGADARDGLALRVAALEERAPGS